ncbi:MAG: hypothetical protein HY274_10525 [Gammaproteobacteria bacterium]|nr:hypothetical protein [Gammaproteobacteria bacterium]
MDKSSTPDKTATGENAGTGQGIAWIAQGWHLVQDRKPLWFGMAAAYLVFGFALKLIPFMGDLLLVLVSPMLLAGVVDGLVQQNGHERAEANGTGPSLPPPLQAWLVQPAQELIRIFSQENKIFGAVLLGIVTLGLAMLVKITGYLLIGGSMISGLTAGQLSATPVTTVLGMGLVTVLYLLLAMGLFYSVPLTVLKNRPPFEAIAESFVACRDHAVPLLALTVPFLAVYLLILAAFAMNHWFGYLLTFSAGLVALPVFVASVYGSYQSFFPSAPRR